MSVPEHAGLILFSDGVPLFKSSGMMCPAQVTFLCFLIINIST